MFFVRNEMRNDSRHGSHAHRSQGPALKTLRSKSSRIDLEPLKPGRVREMAATSRRTRSPPRSTSCIGGTGEPGQRLRPNAPAALPGSQGGPQLASSCSTVIPIGGRSLSIKTPQAARDAGCAIADMSGLRLRWRLLSFLRSSAWRYRPNLFSVAPSLKRAPLSSALSL